MRNKLPHAIFILATTVLLSSGNMLMAQMPSCMGLFVIDDFDLVNVMLETANMAPVGTTDFTTVDIADANKTLGGERDAFLEVEIAATEVFEMGTDASEASLRINEPTGGDAIFLLTYDGDDNDAVSLNSDINNVNSDPLGLVGTDFSTAAFQITAKPPVSLDANVQELRLRVTVYSSTTASSVSEIEVTQSGTITFPEFTGTADMASIKAIQLEILTSGTAIDVEFDDFIIDCSIVIPVELAYLQANTVNCQASLKWATASEYNFSHFEVERSTDGKLFTTIDKIGGAINSVDLLTYSFTEPMVAPIQYYRLKQVDLDETYEYSRTVVVKADCQKGKMVVYPTLVDKNQQLTIELPNSNSQVLSILDLNGQQVLQITTAEQTQLQLEVGTLPAGTYFLSDTQGNIARFTIL